MREPKVIITLVTKKGKEVRMQGNAIKIKKRHNSSLMKKAKLNDFKKLKIEVDYGSKTTNSMECKTFSDLRWAIDSFLDKHLWL